MQTDLKSYLKSSWKHILIIICIFIISVLAGLFVPLEDLGLPENYIQMLKNSLDWIKGLNPIAILLVIFLNNAVKSFFAIVLGVGLGIIPVLFVGGNGIVLGLVAIQTFNEKGLNFVLAALLPHGIIEIPMILISAGLGLRLGISMYNSIRGEKIDMRSEFVKSLQVFTRIIMPLLFIAAMIETFVTPVIVLMVSG